VLRAWFRPGADHLQLRSAIEAGLVGLSTLYPDLVDEACFIDATGQEIARVVRCASDDGVEVQGLSTLTGAPPVRPGLVLGYGAIATADIREGLRRLRQCFASRPTSAAQKW